MSLLRALRAYVGLGPDEDYEDGGLVRSATPGRGGHSRTTAGNDAYWSYGAAEPSAGDGRRAASVGGNRSAGPAQSQGTKRTVTANDRGLRDEGPDFDNVDLDDEAPEDTEDGQDVIDLRDGNDDQPGSDRAVVRSLDAVRTRPKTVSPESFAEARQLADEFRVGTPVVLNLHGIDRELARRLIDFASGVCYCMDGTMEKIGSNVFLLTPEGVEVGDEDRVRILQRGYAR